MRFSAQTCVHVIPSINKRSVNEKIQYLCSKRIVLIYIESLILPQQPKSQMGTEISRICFVRQIQIKMFVMTIMIRSSRYSSHSHWHHNRAMNAWMRSCSRCTNKQNTKNFRRHILLSALTERRELNWHRKSTNKCDSMRLTARDKSARCTIHSLWCGCVCATATHIDRGDFS